MAHANGRIPASDLAALPLVFSNKREQEHLTEAAYASLVRMMLRAVAETDSYFSIYDAYRSLDEQVAMLKKNYTKVSRGRSKSSDRSYGGSTWAKKSGRPLTASPGHSNHGNGLAVDIHPAAIQNWMKSNAGRFGWVNDVPSEPWHWSYLNPGRDQYKSEGLPNVAAIQKKLGITADGKPGPEFAGAVREFQKKNGLTVDGKAGPNTIKAILGGSAPASIAPKQGSVGEVALELPALPKVETGKTSPNKNADRRGHSIKHITVHWWGEPSGQSFDGIVDWLCNPKANVSAHYVISADRVARVVDEAHRSWANGNGTANSESITIECDPNDVLGTLPVLAALIADIRGRHGDLPIYPHSHWTSTLCCGDYEPHLGAVDQMARTGKTIVSAASAASQGGIKVDGRWGKETTKALQRFLKSRGQNPGRIDGRMGPASWKALQRYLNEAGAGIVVDGLIENQSYKHTELGNGISPNGWQHTGRNSKGSKTIRNLQKWVGVKQDGVAYEGTSEALQRKLNAHAGVR